MSENKRRGYIPSDKQEFGEQAHEKLSRAANDLYYLLNQNYPIKGASEFVGNHYLLSKRQRLALMRTLSSKEAAKSRKDKCIRNGLQGSIIHMDGFNTIITLEVALSQSLLLKCIDGTIRDLAGLRGTYHLIPQTEEAINLIGRMLTDCQVKKVIIYLDAPVSNSGRLKQKILEVLGRWNVETQVEVAHNVDQILKELDYVVTSDAIILDQCKSWINLNEMIITEYIKAQCLALGEY